MRKPNQKFNIVVYYLHRYVRITPALAVLYIFQVTLAKRIQDGPMNPLIMKYIDNTCLNGNWWSFFLYVQNYVVPDRMVCLWLPIREFIFCQAKILVYDSQLVPFNRHAVLYNFPFVTTTDASLWKTNGLCCSTNSCTCRYNIYYVDILFLRYRYVRDFCIWHFKCYKQNCFSGGLMIGTIYSIT